jgi:hypothetical protein
LTKLLHAESVRWMKMPRAEPPGHDLL